MQEKISEEVIMQKDPAKLRYVRIVKMLSFRIQFALLVVFITVELFYKRLREISFSP